MSSVNYFVSQPRLPNLDVSGDQGDLGGWLLASNPDNSFDILYNPMNRAEIFSASQPTSLYSDYCSTISLQDPNCYCLSSDLTPKLGEAGNYCYFSSLEPDNLSTAKYNGKELGTMLETLASSSTDTNLSSEINTVKMGCNCLGICRKTSDNNANIPLSNSQEWKTIFGLENGCPIAQNITIQACLNQLGTGAHTYTANGDVNISCNQKVNPPPPPPPPPPKPNPPSPSSPSSNHTYKKIIIGLIISVIIVLGLLLVMKKRV